MSQEERIHEMALMVTEYLQNLEYNRERNKVFEFVRTRKQFLIRDCIHGGAFKNVVIRIDPDTGLYYPPSSNSKPIKNILDISHPSEVFDECGMRRK